MVTKVSENHRITSDLNSSGLSSSHKSDMVWRNFYKSLVNVKGVFEYIWTSKENKGKFRDLSNYDRPSMRLHKVCLSDQTVGIELICQFKLFVPLSHE